MINSEVLAKFGLFFIAALGYAFITGVAGLIWGEGDDSSTLCSAWFIGCFMYAITVVLMWQG